MSTVPLSVSALNLQAKSLLESTFTRIFVIGEISNLAIPRSGHLYFSLKDDQSQIRCALFKGNAMRLSFTPSDGQQVLATGKISLYAPRGDFQLIVESLEEAGAGLLQQQFEQLKKKLQSEGYFDAQHKKTIPPFPKHIGVVTSPSGAAIRDILTTLNRRFPNIPVTIYPTQVQGATAKHEIKSAIELANTHNQCDVLIVSRGGGSIEDLWAFNEEIVAMAIYHSKIPLISGVGHEVDFTIADFVADCRAPTPTAAAELASPNRLEWIETISSHEAQLIRLLRNQLQHATLQYQLLAQQLRHPKARLQAQMQQVDWLEQTLFRAIERQLTHAKQQYQHNAHQLYRQSLLSPIQSFKQVVTQQKQRLSVILPQRLALLQSQCAGLEQALQAISPHNTLARGYAIVQDDSGEVLRSVKQATHGSRIQTRVIDGEFTSLVE